MTQLQKTVGIVQELDQEKVRVNVESLEWVGKKKTYAEVLLKVGSNTIGTNSYQQKQNCGTEFF